MPPQAVLRHKRSSSAGTEPAISKATSTPFPDMRLISPSASFERAFTVLRRPEFRRKASLSSERSTATIWRAGEPRAEDDAQAHAP